MYCVEVCVYSQCQSVLMCEMLFALLKHVYYSCNSESEMVSKSVLKSVFDPSQLMPLVSATACV